MTEEQLQIALIQRVMHKKNYKFFSNGIYNLNIIGIRSANRTAGVYDDWICCIYKDSTGVFQCKKWKASTDAGTYWLKHPLNEKGTALLVAGQYLGAFQIGVHKGKYKALVQKLPVAVYRDSNNNKIIDMKPSTIQTGMFGINIHRSNPTTQSVINDKWSAGCQVFANPKDFDEFMTLVDKSSAAFGNTFTYTLLDSSDFDGL